MKVKKRHILFVMIFIAALALIYVIVSAFSFNTLNFKVFYSSDEYSTYDETKFTYSIDENEDIKYSINFEFGKEFDNWDKNISGSDAICDIDISVHIISRDTC